MPVIPATQEAEAGESLESGAVEVAVSRDRATTLELPDRARLCLKTNKQSAVSLREEQKRELTSK